MSAKSHALEIESVVLYKFGSLISGAPIIANKSTSIDITLQVQEYNIFESVFSSCIKVELAVIDHVGLLVNFPLSGEEAVVLRYSNIKDRVSKTLYLIIDSVKYMNVDDRGRAMGYMINCIAIEAYANAKQTVQQSYRGDTASIVRNVFNEHISERINRVFPQYVTQPLIIENNDTATGIWTVPNVRPFQAIQMLGQMAVSVNSQTYTNLFYQTTTAFYFVTLQSLFDNGGRVNLRAKAMQNKYLYLSDTIDDHSSKMNNDDRLVTNLIVNKRLSSLQKLALGYYHNTLFEINLAQKAVWAEPTYVENVTTIYDNKLNTDAYTQLAYVEGDEEQSNRTKYVLTTQRENDDNFPVSRMRDKWGKDLSALTAMAQIDLTVTIPGTTEFSAGDLFFLEIPEMHGFNSVDQDDLISGLFLITEVKQMLHVGGYHTTVLRLNKDSYLSSIDRESRYV